MHELHENWTLPISGVLSLWRTGMAHQLSEFCGSEQNPVDKQLERRSK